jgi:hypothetical protein
MPRSSQPEIAYELEPQQRPDERMLVPLKHRSYGDYRVYVSRTEARFFTDETLPDFIKARLAMLCARGDPMPMTDEEVHARGRYAYYLDPETQEIGKRLSPSYFVLSVTKEQFNLLGGDCKTVPIV